MFSRDRIYGFDIETDTTVNGLDPAVSRITEVALSTEDGDRVFAAGDESQLLSDFDDALAELPPGLLSGWNSAFFDLPFIWSRYTGADGSGTPMPGAEPMDFAFGMQPVAFLGVAPKYDYMRGYDAALTCTWASGAPTTPGTVPGAPAAALVHQHLDVSRAYERMARELGTSWSLKPVCRALCIDMVEVDRTRMHELTPEQRAEYACSDSRGARELAVRLLGV